MKLLWLCFYYAHIIYICFFFYFAFFFCFLYYRLIPSAHTLLCRIAVPPDKHKNLMRCGLIYAQTVPFSSDRRARDRFLQIYRLFARRSAFVVVCWSARMRPMHASCLNCVPHAVVAIRIILYSACEIHIFLDLSVPGERCWGDDDDDNDGSSSRDARGLQMNVKWFGPKTVFQC